MKENEAEILRLITLINEKKIPKTFLFILIVVNKSLLILNIFSCFQNKIIRFLLNLLKFVF